VLSLYAHGNLTGLALSHGDGLASAVPVFEGKAIPQAVTTKYDLPDGKVLEIGQQMSEMIAGSIQESDMDIRLDLYENIVLSGGKTMIMGYDNALMQSLKSVCPIPMAKLIEIKAQPNRNILAW